MTAQSFAYERKENSAVIWRCFSHDKKAEIPEEIDGLKVTAIAPYAFSAHMDGRTLEKGIREGKIQIYVPEFFRAASETESGEPQLPPALCGNLLEEIVFPTGVSRVGRYCFYNCERLQKLTFSGTLADWETGVFTGCHRVKELTVRIRENGVSFLKGVLEELREELRVEYRVMKESDAPEAEWEVLDCAQLVFPEFFLEGIENTPARILEERVHGTGVHYRNCFHNRIFDFRQYDSLFAYAVTQEPQLTMAEMAMKRLRFPYQLGEKAREQYQQYVKEHALDLAEFLMERRAMDGIVWLLSVTGKEEMLLHSMTELASRHQYAEGLSYLMEAGRGTARPAARRRREL